MDSWGYSNIDAWLEEGFCVANHVNIPTHMKGATVKDISNDDGTWNWRLMGAWTLEYIHEKIVIIGRLSL